MTQRDKKKWTEMRNRITRASESNNALDVFLAMDRFVVELSMRVYDVPRNERSLMRKQNRRLHGALRRHLPRLLRPSQSPS